MKILIVDDNSESRYMLEYMLRAGGCQTESASNGIAALEKLMQGTFDAVISDILMPKMDGYRLIQECRNDPALTRIPFIFYTANYTEQKDIDFGLSLGAVRYIIKPKEPDEFLPILHEVLKDISGKAPGEPPVPAMKESVFQQEYSKRLIEKMDKKIRELTESEERLRTFAGNLPGIVYRLYIGEDANSMEFFNDQVQVMTGYTPDELTMGRICSIEPYILPEDRTRVVAVVNESILNKSPFEVEYRFRHKSGNICTFLERGRPELNAKGRVTSIDGVIFDITDQKETEEALRQANKKLNLLSSITCHDILNGLSVLLGYIDLASDDVHSPGMKEYISHMEKAAKCIRHQIEFTKEYQEIGANAAGWQNIRETVMRAASLFKVEDVSLSVNCKNVEIFADPLLQKVFYNLFDNAFRYAPPFTSITISCTETGDSLHVVFEDNGAGIADEGKKHLFEHGFGKNTGLGLFLSREILAITGITITEDGEPGKGARFRMTVPKGSYRFSGAGKE
ncbi:MAG: hybrid sensory kinase in two-component regulatory system with RcsB and YojN [Methanoregulaceae archaeon PtaB.Bin108]|nr:MAG: hybrid sensory kinase in two-component regulatory system with RcsB and YojN [Methanoregulaceae archaeon PtaB.Bin108]